MRSCVNVIAGLKTAALLICASGVIPARDPAAPAGSAAMAHVAAMPATEREAYLEAQIEAGNVPAFLRSFRPIRVTALDGGGHTHTAVFEAAPDYLSVGSDTDFVRTPLTPMTAARIAERFGCVLPTRKMVNDIYLQAELKLEPRPMTVARESVATFLEHNAIVEKQRQGNPAGMLVAGIMKDVVQTPLLLKRPGHVAIYGWHKLDGTPIQPLTTVHIETYVDYSHGIRLIHRMVILDGKPTAIEAVLGDPDLKSLLSDE